MPLSGWPLIVDDDGTGQSGTAVDKSWADDVRDSIEDALYSATNPAIDPAAITDEVVEARGTKPSLGARLDVALEPDGDLILPEAVVEETEFKYSRGFRNLIVNDQFLLWPISDAAQPGGWVLAGAGGTIARTGTGLGDTERKHGKFAAKVTSALGVKTTLTQTLLDAAVVADPTFFSYKLSVGTRAKTGTASRVTISVNDGVTETASSAHSGSGVGGPEGDGWEWLSVTHTISPSATKIDVVLNISAGTAISAYWSGVVAILSEIAPGDWFPADVELVEYRHFISGSLSAATDIVRFPVSGYGILRDIQMVAKTAPTGNSIRIDVNQWDGAAFSSVFAAAAQINDGVNRGSRAADGTYARRCLVPEISTGAATQAGELSIDIDGVGSGTAGADVSLVIRILQYTSPWASLRAYDDV